VGEISSSWQNIFVNDYERVARIIRFLDEHRVDQPELSVVAARAGLSPFHLHRLFSSWAGVTPKDFLQCLTLAHAKERLRDGAAVLEAALETGLSGPGRLHDLCVNLEAASPGELKEGGSGWTIKHGVAESPFGKCLVAESPRGICHLSFFESERPAIAGLKAEWPRAKWKRDDAMAVGLASQVFIQPGAGAVPGAPLRAFVRGTSFQVKVWRALLLVSAGSLTTYGRLAQAIGMPTASRAVGTAVGQNPLAYLIPCHRVIRETGIFGNYRWSPDRKRAMIAWETAETDRETLPVLSEWV